MERSLHHLILLSTCFLLNVFFFFMKKTEIPIFRQMYILILNKLIFTESKWLLIKQDMQDANCPHTFLDVSRKIL